MSTKTYRTRSVTVQAIQFDGSNLSELEVAIKEVTGHSSNLGELLEIGAWVIISTSSYQILPNSVFTRVYEPVDPVADSKSPTHVLNPQRSCHSCLHYSLSNTGVGRCELFNEVIDSELLAAEDCSAFEAVTY